MVALVIVYSVYRCCKAPQSLFNAIPRFLAEVPKFLQREVKINPALLCFLFELGEPNAYRI